VNVELYSGEVNNIKELEAAEKSLNAIKEKVDFYEERAIQLMEILENNDNGINRLMEELEAKKADFRRVNKYYNDRKLEMMNLLEDISRRKEILTRKIDPESMEFYLKLCRKNDNGQGMAIIQKGICSGCHMALSFDLLKKAKNDNVKIICDNCGRLLVTD
jgi:predicted  nucleic acid-binding Zn-ribbon protein